MLTSLTISHWTARKLDKRVTNEVHAQHNAASDAGRYNKALVRKQALLPITQIINEARAAYLSLTLPWQDGGQRLLPAKAFNRFTEKMRDFRWRFENEVAIFVAAYPEHIEVAKQTLGDIFNLNDYPSDNEVAGKFGFKTEIMPMPDADDFRVMLADEVVGDMRAQIGAEIEAKAKAAHNDMVERVRQVLTTMADKLTNYDPEQGVGVFRNSLVGNVRDLAEIVPELNMSGDDAIDGLADAMKQLASVEAEDLRDDAVLRKATAAEADRLAELAKTYLA
jgi:hypothetical protein